MESVILLKKNTCLSNIMSRMALHHCAIQEMFETQLELLIKISVLVHNLS